MSLCVRCALRHSSQPSSWLIFHLMQEGNWYCRLQSGKKYWWATDGVKGSSHMRTDVCLIVEDGGEERDQLIIEQTAVCLISLSSDGCRLKARDTWHRTDTTSSNSLLNVLSHYSHLIFLYCILQYDSIPLCRKHSHQSVIFLRYFDQGYYWHLIKNWWEG